jgi:nucleotide-binding universal stress UspA family protein
MIKKPNHILLASHGTRGARAAERAALALCPAGGTLHHLLVVPDFWKGMMGDDWLNSGVTRDIYGKYVESELEKEVRQHLRRLDKETAKRRLRYKPEVVFGKPDKCLIERLGNRRIDMVVIGSPRPPNEPGYRSRMLTEKVLRASAIPVLVVPFPHG